MYKVVKMENNCGEGGTKAIKKKKRLLNTVERI